MRGGFAPARQGTPRVAQSVTLPSPWKGLNTRDSLANMDPEYAINLTNWVAAPGGPKVRSGYRIHATGLPSYVETLAPYTSTSVGGNRVFAWSSTSIYNVTSSGAVGAAVVTGLTNARWSYVNMTGSAGQYLVCANGTDAVRHYNGTSWTTWTTVGSPANPGEISGVSVATLKHPMVHQRRLWFVEANSSKGWYLPINSVGGAANYIDFGPAFPRGGALAHLASWSLDGGQGLRNLLVAVSVNGDVVIYEGTDPSNLATFSISGTWRLAAPGCDKPLFQFGGDVLYLSMDGLMPLSEYMQDKQTAVALSDAIRPTLGALTLTQSGLHGWQLHDVLSENLLVVNVPQINPTDNFQFVFNTITRGWSVFSGWAAQCWATLGNTHYFGGYQQVCIAFSGTKDGAASDGTGGSIYTAAGQQAGSYLSEHARARNKHCTAMRLNLTTASPNPTVALAINVDFDRTPPSSIGAAVPITQSLWDTASWDAATWGGGLSNYNAWQSVAAHGYWVSPVVAVSVLGETQWDSTDVMFELGGILT